MRQQIIPLSRWADRQLRKLATATGSSRIAKLSGAAILGERGANGGYINRGRISPALGGSHLMRTRDLGWFCLSLIRDADRDLMPALFSDPAIDGQDWAKIESAAAQHICADLVQQGRDLGLPCAALDETPVSLPVDILAEGKHRPRPANHRPLVIDLSAIWAGPLAGHLLWLAGCEVVKVESRNRPDLIRRDDPATFDRINQGKASVLVDLYDASDRAALIRLIHRADIVIESSRPRALRQLGIDADALVREVPGLVWLTITGHGAGEPMANWTGIGNDCGVAGGLSRAMAQAGGAIGFVGDAIADPLTGITTALAGWRAYQSGKATRIGFAMSAIAADALADEQAFDPAALTAEFQRWGAGLGQAFPPVDPRPIYATVRQLGADTAQYLSC